MNASVSNAAVARPDVPIRMLNGGISSSAIFIAGQLKPQAKLTATSMRRARPTASFAEAGGTLQGSGSRQWGGEHWCRTGAVGLRKGRGAAEKRPAETFRHVAPQVAVCYATARFRGVSERAGALPRRCKVSSLSRAWRPPSATVPSPRNCRKRILVAGEHAVVAGMAGRYATALFELAR